MRRSGKGTGVPELEPEVFDRVVVPVAMTAGPDHVLVYHNEAFRDLFGPRRLGLPAREVFDEPAAAGFLAMLDDVFGDRAARQVTSPRTTEGTAPGAPGPRHFVYSCSPVVTRHGPGVLAVAIDTTVQVTAVRHAEELSEQRHQALQRYEALMSAVNQIVWVMQPTGEIQELVGGFQDFTGIPWRPVIDQEWLAQVHPYDRNRLVHTWREAAADPPSMFVCTFRMRTATGTYRHVQSRAVPIMHGGEAAEWIGTTADVEDQWRNRLRERLLARVATVTAADDVPQAFAAVTAAVVPELADVCAVFLLPPQGLPPGPEDTLTATRIAATARDGLPELPPLSHEPRPVGHIAREVVESRRPRLLTFPAGQPPPGVLPELSTKWLRETDATSITLVPIVIEASVVAFAAAAACNNSPAPGPADLQLLGEVLNEVRDPLRQAIELQRTRQTALTLQRALLTPTPRVPGAQLSAHYQPASRTAEIGGDWYDSLVLPDGSVTLTIGDIAGHDLDAATSMSQLRSMLRVIAYDESGPDAPARSLTRLDRVVEGLEIAPLVTAVHTCLEPDGDRWHAAWSNAGHPPPLLLPAAGPPRFLEGEGPDLPLCVAPELTRRTWRHELRAGDTLLLYTDGLIEVPGTDLSEGMTALAAQAVRARKEGAPLAALCAQLLAAAADRRDDAAVIGFRPTAPPGRKPR